MPRVPAAPQTVVTESVESAPIRTPLQSIRGAGVDTSGLARGIMSGAEAIERGNLQLSQIRISEAETEILNRWNARLNEDDDAYFKKGGQDAVESLDPYMKELDEIASEVMGRLKTGTERRLLTEALTLRRMNNRTKMSLRSFDARQEWDKDTALANRLAQFEAAANDPSPENLKLTRVRVVDETNAISKIDHLPKEAADRNAEVAVSQMYTAAIEAVIAAEQPFLALEMLNRYGSKGSDEILNDDETKLKLRLNEITVAAESRNLAIDAREHSDNAEQQLKFIERKYGKNPNARQTEIIERASQKASTTRNQIETAQGIARSENFNFLGERVIAATQQGNSGIAIIEALQTAFPERFEGEVLTTAQRSALQNLANVGQPTETTSEGMMTYLKIMELAATNPSVLSDLDPADYLGSMASKEHDKVTKAINEAKGAGITSETAALGSRQKVLNDNAEKHGFDLSKSELSGAGLLIQRESIERLDEFVAVQKRQPTEKEWLDIVDGLFIKVLLDDPRPPIDTTSIFAVPSALFRGFGEPEEGFAFNLQIADIPELQRRVVVADFKAKNNGRKPLPNELETHFIALMDDPITRSILLGK